jgi:NADH-quinone oxidoreductase subunit C
MISKLQTLINALKSRFGAKIINCTLSFSEVSIEVKPSELVALCVALRDETQFSFSQLLDLCAVDYSQFAMEEWNDDASSGFSRGVSSVSSGRLSFGDTANMDNSNAPRFAVVMHLLSYSNNQRIRIRCFAEDNHSPVVPSVSAVWSSANWNEREAYDLFGIVFDGHPDLRRILTDYGFVGYPFRKDFPLIGHVEMRYDPDKKQVVYEPVSIEPRVLVPRVIRSSSLKKPNTQG